MNRKRFVVLDRNDRIYDEAPTIGSACELASVLDRIGIYGPYRAVEMEATEPQTMQVAA